MCFKLPKFDGQGMAAISAISSGSFGGNMFGAESSSVNREINLKSIGSVPEGVGPSGKRLHSNGQITMLKIGESSVNFVNGPFSKAISNYQRSTAKKYFVIYTHRYICICFNCYFK